MTARTSDPKPGIPAKWVAQCTRCWNEIRLGDRIVFKRGRAIHVECANGADDE